MIKCAYFIVALIAVQSLFHAAVSRPRRADTMDTVKVMGTIEPALYMLRGETRYYGMNIEAIEEMGPLGNFRPHFTHTQNYGRKNLQGKWSGLVLALLEKKANLSGVTLARTPDRREVLSFSDHFETEGFSFLVKRVPATENLTTIPELAKAPKMAFAMKTGGMQSDYFEAHPKGTPEALIYKRFKNPVGKGGHIDKLAQGIANVRDSDGDYAFVVSYDVGTAAIGKPPCELKRVGHFAQDLTHLGLATIMNDPFLERVDKALALLKKNGRFDEIKSKWLEGPCTIHKNDKSTDKSSTSGADTSAAAIFDSIVLAFLLSAFY